jgi:hypothetical protein
MLRAARLRFPSSFVEVEKRAGMQGRSGRDRATNYRRASQKRSANSSIKCTRGIPSGMRPGHAALLRDKARYVGLTRQGSRYMLLRKCKVEISAVPRKDGRFRSGWQ